MASEQVTIAKMDAEANDIPDAGGDEIRGFPAFKLYPADKKAAPVRCLDDRTVDDWAEFIKEYGAHQVGIDL